MHTSSKEYTKLLPFVLCRWYNGNFCQPSRIISESSWYQLSLQISQTQRKVVTNFGRFFAVRRENCFRYMHCIWSIFWSWIGRSTLNNFISVSKRAKYVQKTFACVASVPIQAKQNSEKEFSYSGRVENGARRKKVKDLHLFALALLAALYFFQFVQECLLHRQRKYPYPHQGRSLEILREWGVSRAKF